MEYQIQLTLKKIQITNPNIKDSKVSASLTLGDTTKKIANPRFVRNKQASFYLERLIIQYDSSLPDETAFLTIWGITNTAQRELGTIELSLAKYSKPEELDRVENAQFSLDNFVMDFDIEVLLKQEQFSDEENSRTSFLTDQPTLEVTTRSPKTVVRHSKDNNAYDNRSNDGVPKKETSPLPKSSIQGQTSSRVDEYRREFNRLDSLQKAFQKQLSERSSSQKDLFPKNREIRKRSSVSNRSQEADISKGNETAQNNNETSSSKRSPIKRKNDRSVGAPEQKIDMLESIEVRSNAKSALAASPTRAKDLFNENSQSNLTQQPVKTPPKDNPAAAEVQQNLERRSSEPLSIKRKATSSPFRKGGLLHADPFEEIDFDEDDKLNLAAPSSSMIELNEKMPVIVESNMSSSLNMTHSVLKISSNIREKKDESVLRKSVHYTRQVEQRTVKKLIKSQIHQNRQEVEKSRSQMMQYVATGIGSLVCGVVARQILSWILL